MVSRREKWFWLVLGVAGFVGGLAFGLTDPGTDTPEQVELQEVRDQ